jgi:hypothetical protein
MDLIQPRYTLIRATLLNGNGNSVQPLTLYRKSNITLKRDALERKQKMQSTCKQYLVFTITVKGVHLTVLL